jgi:hypothetical protein
MDENLAALDAALDELNAAIAGRKPAPELETVTISAADYDFAVKCLNAARERLIGGDSADMPQARIEIDWALVGLGQDIPA